MDGEQLLTGNASQVWRVGDTVRKPGAAWDVGVQALLRHLEAAGFEGAPRALGADQRGRSIVSFIAGETHGYPMPAYVWTDDVLTATGTLLRAYHDATLGFIRPTDAGWQGPVPAGADEVICHNDVAPYNIVFQGQSPLALIDFDMAAPGPRIWDVAYAAYRFVPLRAPSDESPGMTPQDQGRRLASFLTSYGGAFTAAELLDEVPVRLSACRAFIHQRAAAGEASFARHLAEGDADIYLRDAQYVDARRDELLEGIA